MSNVRNKRFTNVNQSKSNSLINLTTDKKTKETNSSKESPSGEKAESSEIYEPKVSFCFDSKPMPIVRNIENCDEFDGKLEPISNDKDVATFQSKNIMISPTENIKARLSAGKNRDMDYLSKNLEKFNLLENSMDEEICEALTMTGQNIEQNSAQKFIKPINIINCDARPKSLTSQVETDQRIGSLCTEMLSTAKKYGNVTEVHQQDFEVAKNETARLLNCLQETDSMNSKLEHSKFLTSDTFEIPKKDIDLVNQIWNEEYNFRKDLKQDFIKADRNGNVIKTDVVENKTKLLAALRAIDNGDEIDDINYDSSFSNTKNKLIDF